MDEWAGCAMERVDGVWTARLRDGRVFTDPEGERGEMSPAIYGRLQEAVRKAELPGFPDPARPGWRMLPGEATVWAGFAFDHDRWCRVWAGCRQGEEHGTAYMDTPCGLRVWDPYPEQALEQRRTRLMLAVRQMEEYAQRAEWHSLQQAGVNEALRSLPADYAGTVTHPVAAPTGMTWTTKAASYAPNDPVAMGADCAYCNGKGYVLSAGDSVMRPCAHCMAPSAAPIVPLEWGHKGWRNFEKELTDKLNEVIAAVNELRKG